MLKLRDDRLVWGDADDGPMSRVLGSDHAVKHWAPVLSSIAKAAVSENVRHSHSIETLLFAENLIRKQAKEFKELARESTYTTRFFQHQNEDLYYMKQLGLPAYLLGHEPGVGKTLIAMMWARRIVRAQRILVICPNSAKDQWRREIRRWLGKKDLPVTIVDGRVDEQIVRASRKQGWVIGHWESLVHARLGYMQLDWDAIILDEAHNIQNRQALRTDTALALATRSEHRCALTAHPFANDLSELWPILAFLYPERYTSFWRWAGLHIDMVPKPFGGFDMTGAKRPRLLKWELRPFLLRRTKRSVFKSLPRISRQRLDTPLTERGQREYGRIKKQFFAELEAEAGNAGETFLLPIINVFARTTRLRQYLVDPGLLGAKEKSTKYPVVLELLKDTAKPFVIFTSFAQAAMRLQDFLRKSKLQTRVLQGSMKKGQSAQAQVQFHRGDLHALICVTGFAKESLNLGGFGYVAHLDLPWNAKDYEQTEGRVDRPQEGTGKLVPTTSYRLITPGTYEEKMEKKLEKKHRRFGEVFTLGSLKELFNG